MTPLLEGGFVVISAGGNDCWPAMGSRAVSGRGNEVDPEGAEATSSGRAATPPAPVFALGSVTVDDDAMLPTDVGGTAAAAARSAAWLCCCCSAAPMI